MLRGLDRLQEVAITKEGRQMTLRTPATGVIGPLFKAARIALRPTCATRARLTVANRTAPRDANHRRARVSG